MKEKGGILGNLLRWLSNISIAVEGIGILLDMLFIRIIAFTVLVFVIIVSELVSVRQKQSLTSRRASKLKHWEKYYANVKQELLEEELSEVERREKQQEEVDLLQEKAEITDKYCKQENDRIKENSKRRHTYVIAFAILFVLNMRPMYAQAKEWINNMFQNKPEQGTIAAVKSEDGEIIPQGDEAAYGLDKEEEQNLQENYDESEDQVSSSIILHGMTFYLDDPTLEWIPTPEMEAAVFYVDQDDIDIQMIVKQHMRDILDKNLQDTYNGCLSPVEEQMAAEASRQETIFDDSRDRVKHYAAENNYAEWRRELRHSADLDAIMGNRYKLWDAGKCNGTIALLIANNCQDYALEYQKQGKSGYTILSYYIESIKWSELALSYEGTDKEKIFNYIKARYWDIATCQAIPEGYRNIARAIYLEMGEYEDYIK